MTSIGRRSVAPPFLEFPGSALVVLILADKWTIPVIHSLARGMKRTGVLRRELAGVSQKMLTQTLRRLEKHGLIERTVFPVVPPRVEYRLTALGESINEPLARLCEWTKQNGTALERSLAGRGGGVRGRGREEK
jgi:DNA-binding HxlR family transcriptional regulator